MIQERVGKICLDAKQYAAAAVAFQEAQKIDPAGAARWSLNLAQIYQAQGKSAEALNNNELIRQFYLGA